MVAFLPTPTTSPITTTAGWLNRYSSAMAGNAAATPTAIR